MNKTTQQQMQTNQQTVNNKKLTNNRYQTNRNMFVVDSRHNKQLTPTIKTNKQNQTTNKTNQPTKKQ